MGAKKQIEIVKRINSLEEYEQKTSADYGKVVVIDYHLDWCGPCQVIEPNFRGIYFQVEEAAKRLEFVTASESVLPEGLAEKLELGAKPTFMIWKDGKQQAKITGVLINDID